MLYQGKLDRVARMGSIMRTICEALLAIAAAIAIGWFLTGCATDEPSSTCTTTLWGERTPDVITCDGHGCITTELYAAAVTVREVPGTSCEAEALLTEQEPPHAWTHDCGCEETSK